MGLRGGNGGGICCGMYVPFLLFSLSIDLYANDT